MADYDGFVYRPIYKGKKGRWCDGAEIDSQVMEIIGGPDALEDFFCETVIWAEGIKSEKAVQGAKLMLKWLKEGWETPEMGQDEIDDMHDRMLSELFNWCVFNHGHCRSLIIRSDGIEDETYIQEEIDKRNEAGL